MDVAELDFFTPVVPKDKWHDNYARVMSSIMSEEREVLKRWAEGILDRDNKMVKEFQRTFNSSFWEIYLYALFRDLGCQLDQSHSSPDFFVSGGPLGMFTAEAVISSNPEKGTKESEWDPERLPAPRDAILDLACLRLCQAIISKHDKWKKNYSKEEHAKGKPFVVCVAPFEQPWASLQGTEAIDRVLFQGVRRVVAAPGECTPPLLMTRSDKVFKKSQTPVELGLFTNEKYSEISAVLFSSLATWGKVRAMAEGDRRHLMFQSIRYQNDEILETLETGEAYSESIVDGANLFINPFAENPIDEELFFEAGFVVHSHDSEGKNIRFHNGSLLHRTAIMLTSGDEGVPEPRRKDDYSDHIPARPRDGEEFSPAQGPFIRDSALQTYRGWTLFVGQDETDGDWAVGAEPVLCRSLEEFRAAAASCKGGFLTPFMETRAEAVKDAEARIDKQCEQEANQ